MHRAGDAGGGSNTCVATKSTHTFANLERAVINTGVATIGKAFQDCYTGESGIYDEAIKVQTIVDWSIEKAAAHMASSLSFERVEACHSEEALERRGTVLDADDLPDLTVADLRKCVHHRHPDTHTDTRVYNTMIHT